MTWRRCKAVGVVSVVVASVGGCAHGGAERAAARVPPATRLDTVALATLDSAVLRYARAAAAYDPAAGYPRSTNADGRWSLMPKNDWTSGFFPGVLWYLYHYTGEEALRGQAERWTLPLAGIPQLKYNHDLGFQFNSSFVNGYRFTGDRRYAEPALGAAQLLAGRFRPVVGAIKSWDWTDPKRPYPVIVDNMMNLELLLWGARHGGDARWREMALRHARTTMAKHLRADGGSFHVVVFDSTTGAVLERITHQGYADSSTWARGESWLVYGFTMAYRETGESDLLATARRVADYAVARLPADGVPCWDYQAPGCPATERDASAAAILASALLELSGYVPAGDGARYRSAAERILATLASPAYLASGSGDALLRHSVGSKPANSEVDVGLIYADYYFVEALERYLELRGLRPRRVLPARVATAAAPDAGAPATSPETASRTQPAPRLFWLRPELLVSARERVRAGDPALAPALARLTQQADAALSAGPFSVMRKTRIPPSGDKHDYISLGSYWWPDSSKPGGVPYVRRDGRRNPETERDYDHRPLGAMISAVHTLTLAYYFTGKPAYGERAVLLLRTWFLDPATRMKANLNFGQEIPGITPGRGTGIIDTHDLPQLVDDLQLLSAFPGWTTTDREGMRAWAAAFLDWLQTSKNGRQEQRARNNHGSWYDAQVAALALFVGKPQVAREVLDSARTRRIGVQIRADGAQPLELARTRSLHYSVFNLEALMVLAELGRSAGVDLWHYQSPEGGSIRKALDYLIANTAPGATWPAQEISPIEPDLLLRSLTLARLVFPDPRYTALIEAMPADLVRTSRLRLLYAGVAGKP